MRETARITSMLAAFAAGIDYESLPATVTERTKALLLDLTGIALRARFDADSTPSLLSTVRRLGLGNGHCRVIGERDKFAAPAAALINGALAHSLDFDDTHAAGSIHPSAPIVPAALAAAELMGSDGRELIAAIVAGYEIQIRLSLALEPSLHYERGFHPTATCGTFGAAAAAGRLLGLSASQMESAFGLCGSMAAGSMQFLYDGAWNKRFHTGYAAMNGLIAATAAAEGQRGAAQALEGQAGFLHAYSPAAQVERVTTGLGTEFETLSIAVKPYPACRYSHAALDALIGLAEQYDIDANDVSAVEVGLPSTGHKIIGEPLSAKQRPHNIVDGQFSMPFVGAVALRERGLAWDDYARHLSNPATLALCKKIRTVVDPAVEAEYPSNMSASVRVDTSGNRYEQLVVVPKGEPSNFMSDAELLNKFGLLVDPYLDHAQRDKLSTTLLLLDHAENITELLALSCPPTQARAL